MVSQMSAMIVIMGRVFNLVDEDGEARCRTFNVFQ